MQLYKLSFLAIGRGDLPRGTLTTDDTELVRRHGPRLLPPLTDWFTLIMNTHLIMNNRNSIQSQIARPLFFRWRCLYDYKRLPFIANAQCIIKKIIYQKSFTFLIVLSRSYYYNFNSVFPRRPTDCKGMGGFKVVVVVIHSLPSPTMKLPPAFLIHAGSAQRSTDAGKRQPRQPALPWEVCEVSAE